MRSVASCYSKHAIKVSILIVPPSQACLSLNLAHSIPEAVTCVYKAKPSSTQLLITLTWCNNFIGQGLTVSVGTDSHPMRKSQGSKKFQFGDSKIDVFWDLSTAQYDAGPEPVSGFYVVVLVDSELGLNLGDKNRGEEYKTEPLGLSPAKLCLVSRSERFCGDGVYSTKARFYDSGEEHEIVIRCDGWEEEGGRSHVLSVCMEGGVD